MTSAPDTRNPATSSLEVRERLVHALNLDLVGPWAGHPQEKERLPGWIRPSSWYLTGFLIPSGTAPEQRSSEDEDDELDETPEPEGGLAEESTEERRAAKRAFFPSSIGLSFLISPDADSLDATVRWGDYELLAPDPEAGESLSAWQRIPRAETVQVVASGTADYPVPDSNGLELHVVERPINTQNIPDMPAGTRSVSVFLVNRRRPLSSSNRDLAYAFQAEIEVCGERPFVPRFDLTGTLASDWDERVADLHYADTPEYATGHGVSADWHIVDGECRSLRTTWIPSGEVAKTDTVEVPGAELSMDALGQLADATAVHTALQPLVDGYRAWIESSRTDVGNLGQTRSETADEVLRRAGIAGDRIQRGIDALANDSNALDAFRIANRAVARALRQRLQGQFDHSTPRWRAFQLAFILLNLPGVIHPTDPDRESVDLLFFPTGGGKTEAYLGLAAFTMVLRRLRNPGPNGLQGAGVTVIMRYTLRLLTLDQLARASGLVCALELERQAAPDRYGQWPIEIGLWVGQGATPNIMGHVGERGSTSARAKTRRYKASPRSNPSPIPLESCPWCGESFQVASFTLLPNDDHPTELRIVCSNYECDFSGDRPLPILGVDEPIYRRLPAFLIATVDKFASLPWVAETGALLGWADRYDQTGFYGPAEPGRGERLDSPLLPPDLVIQDELHLISGPLGTMVGLYESAIEALCVRQTEPQVRPKIVASTATVRQAHDQVQALFGRPTTWVFPPPGPDRYDTYFARTTPVEQTPGRLYLGIASPGKSPKVLMRQVWLALMGAAEREYRDSGGRQNHDNPADPYMTTVGYFNSLRELGGARRILEEEVQHTTQRYSERRRLGENPGLFRDRARPSDVLELTSRESTDKVADARRRLDRPYHERDHVDCAIATNMISVGLDIPRLGLMVVLGQPKTNAEYIQATSRVGRDDHRPGLVVALFNPNKPRDRSHFERFRHYHDTFYRSVEASSVTPFSARALDRGFAGALVALARHSDGRMTPAAGAERIGEVRVELEQRLLVWFQRRVDQQPSFDDLERRERQRSVRNRVVDLLDSWQAAVTYYNEANASLQYQKSELPQPKALLHEMLDTEFDHESHRKFRAMRSLRDVEPEVNLYLKNLSD